MQKTSTVMAKYGEKSMKYLVSLPKKCIFVRSFYSDILYFLRAHGCASGLHPLLPYIIPLGCFFVIFCHVFFLLHRPKVSSSKV